MKIDTHQHFWIYNASDYPWMDQRMESLKKDYLPRDLAPLLRAAGIDGTIAVQARQMAEESRWLLELADQNPWVQGVVGWVDLRSPSAGKELEKLASHPKFRGVRHLIHDEPDDQFMLREDFRRGISKLAAFNLTYDLLLFPRHLPAAYELARTFPKQWFVIDHISKPPISERRLEPWAGDIRRIAALENVGCKISGMVTEANWLHWKREEFAPYLDVIFEAFGTQRLMAGSDWPVCTLAGSYAQVMQLAAGYIQKLSPDEQENVWHQNAKRVYHLPH